MDFLYATRNIKPGPTHTTLTLKEFARITLVANTTFVMQGTVVLGTGEPSPIMKRSPSARLDKKEAFANGEKLFQSFDGTLPRTRRNSIPSPFGIRNETGRGSVPLLLGVPGHRPSSGTTRSSFSRSLKSYIMKGLGEGGSGGTGAGNGGADLSKLDDKLATIKHQLVS